MTEIQVLIPLSVFGDAKDLTPQSISEAISNVSELKSELAKLKTQNETLVQTINSIGPSLQTIWQNSTNDFDRAQKIRELIKNLSEFKS